MAATPPRLIMLGGSTAADYVSQEEMDYVIGIDNQIDRLMATRDAYKKSMLRRLLVGARVQPGVHTAKVVETIEGGKRKQILVIR